MYHPKDLMGVFLLLLTTIFTSCGEKEEVLHPCDPSYTDPSAPSWIHDKIVTLNGSYRDEYKAGDQLLDVRQVRFYEVHGVLHYYVFRTSAFPTYDPSQCFTIQKHVFDCEGNYIGNYTCPPDEGAYPSYPYQIGELSEDQNFIWPVLV